MSRDHQHHHLNFDRQDGDNSFDRPHHQSGFRLQIELANIGFHQSSQFHHMHMGRIHGHFNQSLPYMEIPGGNEYPRNYAPPNYARPNYGSTETSYYQRSYHDPRQEQLEFSNPYQQQHYHHSHHHGRHHGYSEQPGSGELGPVRGDNSNQPGRRSIYTYDGATRVNPEQAMESARVVAQVARRLGVDPVVAVAAMLVESGGNPRAVGDNGHSFGLFQLNSRGELAQAHLHPQQAFDPETNARVALSYFRRGHTSNPGAMAAAAQRPANRADYARKVNSNMAEAARMVEEMGLA
ncbi:MAG: transglycosylase SLT domain-containing protein [Cyanobacteria bacterium SZAS-4]|nr:transglycosylase SLT domain-containing protein [Cyanobacteria bacterium SZAS-4]